jgi:beta-galactosidase
MKVPPVVTALVLASSAFAQKHTFGFGGTNNEEFLLDGKPFQIRSGEIDPVRVPAEYWRHRIRMAKAMGLNTIAPYIFWNDHERIEGKFDFKSESRNIGQFFKICKEEGMWVYLRPGPYVCGEWDGGGLPSYLWKYPDTKFRAMGDSRYTEPVARYFHELAQVVKPHLLENGGNIIMVQIENEYGSYPKHDHSYIVWLKSLWTKEGINGPFSTSDGPSEGMLKDSVLPGAAVGLDSGSSEADWAVARKMNPGVPVFSGETYPGWLRHWGEGDWTPSDVTNDLKFYMAGKKSFSLYLVHGGTNFGFNTGANHGGKGYEPDVTSYDYGCPISEQGLPTKEYFNYRDLLSKALPNEKLIDVPKPIPSMNIPPIELKPLIDIWHTHGKVVASQQPNTFEELGQNQGIVRFETKLAKNASGKLTFDRLSDYATVFVDGKYVGSLDRRLGQKEIEIPTGAGVVDRKLEVLVEGMGRINYSAKMDDDRKGIAGVKLNGNLLSGWEAELFPLNDKWVSNLSQSRGTSISKGQFFRSTFELSNTADTFFDMRKFEKGVVWINGHNLGRFWKIGPQFRLYCPASWLKKGTNTVTVFDLEGTEPKSIEGFSTMR